MTNKEIEELVKELKEKLEAITQEFHALNVRLVKLETVATVAYWAMSGGGLIGIILGIIHIFKALTE